MKTTVREKHLLGRMVCLVTLGLILCVPADAQVPVNVDDLLATCPSAKEISSINRDFTLTFESDPSAGTLVCMASNGSADLTLLMKNAYQALRVMQQIPFDAPFPWTTKNLYDWLKGAILGIRFRGDISSSFCCDPLGVINVQTHNLTILQTGRWVDPQLESGLQDFMVLVVHEARHSEGLPHDCGAFDQTISELGAWGVQYFIEEWLKYHSGTFLTATDPAIVGGGTDVGGNPLSPDYYRLIAWNDAQSVRATDFCTQPIFLSAPAAQNFGSQKVGTTSVPRAVVLAAGTPTAVEIGNIELTGIDKGDFILKVVSCPNAGLPPSCVLTASFSPTTNGIKAANITITDTAPGSPHVVPLLGTAISPSNLPPVANAGPNQTVECSGHGTPVTLDGSRSTDPEGDNLTYLWTNSTGTVVGNSAVISQTLGVGTFNFVLTVTDTAGLSSTANTTVAVQDTKPPTISNLSAAPNMLWPPNHKMIPVTLNYTSADQCSPTVSCSLAVSSNEPNGAQPEWQVVDAHHVLLRAERLGAGKGRTYTVTTTCADPSGNQGSHKVTVVVPHNQ